MRLPFLISIAGALLAAAVLVYLSLATDLLDFGPRDRAAPQTPLAGEARRRALLGDQPLLGFDEPHLGVTVVAAEGGAEFKLPGGRTVAVAPPEGWEVLPEFVILSEINGGFFLAEAGSGATPTEANYVNFGDSGRQLEPTTSQAAIRLYEGAAERIRGVGELPYLDGALEVVEVIPVQDAVFACLRHSDGMLFHYGTRFVGPLWVQVMEPGACPKDRTAITAQLDLAEATLAGNR